MSTHSRLRRQFECPSCGCALVVPIDIEVHPVENSDEPNPSQDWLERQPASVKGLVETGEVTGMLAAFIEAHKKADSSIPGDYRKVFVEFFRTAKPRPVPQLVMDRYSREFPARRLEFHSATGVIAVIADKAVVAFAPVSTICGSPIRLTHGGKLKGRLDVTAQSLEEWIRTRFGYVASPGPMLDQMKRRSIGEIAR